MSVQETCYRPLLVVNSVLPRQARGVTVAVSHPAVNGQDAEGHCLAISVSDQAAYFIAAKQRNPLFDNVTLIERLRPGLVVSQNAIFWQILRPEWALGCRDSLKSGGPRQPKLIFAPT